MALREEENRPLSEAEKKEIAEYEKIIAFHDLVMSGKHPTIKPKPAEIARNVGPTRPLGSNIASSSAGPGAQVHQPFQHTIESLNQVANSSISAEAVIQAISQQTLPQNSFRPHTTTPTGPKTGANVSRAKSPAQRARHSQATLGSIVQPATQPKTSASCPKQAPPTHKEVTKLLYPPQSSVPSQPLRLLSNAPASTKPKDTSRLDYTRDYYQDLGVPHDASKTELSHAVRTLETVSDSQQEGYEILSNDYLRHICDDARAFTSNWAASLDDVEGVRKEADWELEKEAFDLSVDYYKVLGVQPGGPTTTESIDRAYNYKAALTDPERSTFRRRKDSAGEEDDKSRWAMLQKAYAVLSDWKVRKEYDAGRGIPLHYRAPLGNSKGRVNRRRK